jgi:hypothetical protein
MRTTRLRVTLDHVRPTVRRVLDVPAASTLPELHLLLQAGLGWTNSHLHRFETGDAAYTAAMVGFDDGLDQDRDEAGVPISALGGQFEYQYDFGDGWEHTVTVIGDGGERPGCVQGEGACPPEDCGGPGGYAELLAVLADQRHPRHAELRRWAGALPGFDLERADRDVRATAGAVPDTVRTVLDLARDGVRLTPGGRLNRAFVRRVQDLFPDWGYSDRPASVEEDVLPLMALHDIFRATGLWRLRAGVVTTIRAATDDLEVLRRIRRLLDEETFEGSVIGTAAGWLAARGPTEVPRLAAVALDMLGDRWMAGDRPLTVADVEHYLHSQTMLMRGLGMIAQYRFDQLWQPGPAARSLLPRAAGLAAYFEQNQRRFPDGAG